MDIFIYILIIFNSVLFVPKLSMGRYTVYIHEPISVMDFV